MTRKTDIPLLDWHDIPAALGLLSRLPIKVNDAKAVERSAASTWAYPIAGAIIGGLLGVIAWGCLALGLPTSICAGVVLGAGWMITGGLHQDGLADCADGFWGGYTPERRLEIMKDSQIGTYGVLALILITGLQWIALSTALNSLNAIITLAAIGAISRAPLPAIMHGLTQARTSGLSHSVGQPTRNTALIAAGIGAIACLGLGVTALVIASLAALACALLAKQKIGGQTGDTLGATQQIIEVSLLIFIVA